MSSASERTNGGASGPVLPSLFLVTLNHSRMLGGRRCKHHLGLEEQLSWKGFGGGDNFRAILKMFPYQNSGLSIEAGQKDDQMLGHTVSII